MLQRPFKQVDVFTDVAYLGNPLAVVLDGTGLSTEDMQHFARWTNLSETTFVLPPTPQAAAQGADYQVRIFATGYEMPFAGHPTLGTCHAWLEHGGVPKNPGVVVQECKVGLVTIRQGQRTAGPPQGALAPSGGSDPCNGGVWGRAHAAFAAPPLQRHDAEPTLVQALAAALGLQPSSVRASQHLNNGPSHFGLLLDTTDTVLAVMPDFSQLYSVMHSASITGIGVAAVQQAAAPAGLPTGLISRSNREARAFASGSGTARNSAHSASPIADADAHDLEVRFFFDTGNGFSEDPVTGSFNASLAQWLIATGHMPQTYTAAQGTCLGVLGRVHIQQDTSGQVWVGGGAVTCITGTVLL